MTSTASSSLSAANRWLIVLLLMGYAAIGHFNRVGISVAGTEVFIQDKADMNSSLVEADAKQPAFAKVFTKDEMGWVYSAFLIVYSIGMLPGGWLIDRIGASKALTMLGLTMGSFVVLTGILGWLMSIPNHFWMALIVIRSLAGLCSAPLHPGAAHVVSDVTTIRGRATGNGLVTAGALLGIAFSYPLFGKLMDDLSWQGAFVVSGLAMIAYALIWTLLTARKLPAPQPASSQPAADSTIPWPLLKHSDLWVLTLSFAAYGYFQYLFFYWMGYYFEKVLHVPEVESRQAAFIIALSQGAGMVIGGLSNDFICRRLGTARGRRGIVLFGMGLSALFALVSVNLKDASQVALFMALAMGSQGMCESIFWTTATEIGGKSRGFAGAFLNTGGNIGGFISPVLTPIMADRIGWTGAIAVACGICALGGVVWFWIKLPDSDQPPISETLSSLV